MAGLGLMNRRRAIASSPTLPSIVKYDRLVGNGSDFVTLPITYKAGWSYKYSVNVIADLITTATTGMFVSGGCLVYHSTYREMRIDFAGKRVWSAFVNLQTLELNPDGIFRNGSSISTAALAEDAATNISIFKSANGEPAMGNFVHFRSLEVWNADGTLVHKYVPCMDDSGKVGLCDEIAGGISYCDKGTLIVLNDE